MSQERPNHLVFMKKDYVGIETYKTKIEELIDGELQLNTLNIIVSENNDGVVRYDLSYARGEETKRWSFVEENIIDGIELVLKLRGITPALKEVLNYMLRMIKRDVKEGITHSIGEEVRVYKSDYDEKIMNKMSKELFVFKEFNDSLVFNYKDTTEKERLNCVCYLKEDCSALFIELYNDDMSNKKMFDLYGRSANDRSATYNFRLTDVLIGIETMYKDNDEMIRLVTDKVIAHYSRLK